MNDIIWNAPTTLNLRVTVAHGGVSFAGSYLGPSASMFVESDTSVSLGVVIVDDEGTAHIVSKRSRILQYGEGTWRNIVSSHVFLAAEAAAERQGRNLSQSTPWIASKRSVLTGPESMLATEVITGLPNALSGPGGSAYADFIDFLMQDLRRRLAQATAEEKYYAAEMVSSAFGGDAVTYTATRLREGL